MADAGFNGTVLTIGEDEFAILGCSYSEEVGKVEVTPGDENEKVYVPGKPQKSADFKLRGSTVPLRGASGTLSITWNDTGSSEIADVYVSTVTITGQAEGAIDSDVTLKPIAAPN